MWHTNCHHFSNNLFFVLIPDPVISQKVSDDLGIGLEEEEDKIVNEVVGVVLEVDGYAGYESVSLWDWLKKAHAPK